MDYMNALRIVISGLVGTLGFSLLFKANPKHTRRRVRGKSSVKESPRYAWVWIGNLATAAFFANGNIDESKRV